MPSTEEKDLPKEYIVETSNGSHRFINVRWGYMCAEKRSSNSFVQELVQTLRAGITATSTSSSRYPGPTSSFVAQSWKVYGGCYVGFYALLRYRVLSSLSVFNFVFNFNDISYFSYLFLANIYKFTV